MSGLKLVVFDQNKLRIARIITSPFLKNLLCKYRPFFANLLLVLVFLAFSFILDEREFIFLRIFFSLLLVTFLILTLYLFLADLFTFAILDPSNKEIRLGSGGTIPLHSLQSFSLENYQRIMIYYSHRSGEIISIKHAGDKLELTLPREFEDDVNWQTFRNALAEQAEVKERLL